LNKLLWMAASEDGHDVAGYRYAAVSFFKTSSEISKLA